MTDKAIKMKMPRMDLKTRADVLALAEASLKEAHAKGLHTEQRMFEMVIAGLMMPPLGYIDPDGLKVYRGHRCGGTYSPTPREDGRNMPVYAFPQPEDVQRASIFLDGKVTANDALKIAAIVHDFDKPIIPGDFRFDAQMVKDKQLHAGSQAEIDYKGDPNAALWHTDSKGLFWSGSWYHRTPAQLEAEALTTLKHVRELYAQHGGNDDAQ